MPLIEGLIELRRFLRLAGCDLEPSPKLAIEFASESEAIKAKMEWRKVMQREFHLLTKDETTDFDVATILGFPIEIRVVKRV